MDLKNFVKNWFENIDNHQFDSLKSSMSNDHKFHNPMTPAPIGSEEHVGMMQMMTGAFEGKHIIDLLVEEGEWIAAHGRWTGNHTGEFNGVAATGKDVNFSWNDIFHVVDGKVTEEYFEMNPMAIMEQIGAVSA